MLSKITCALFPLFVLKLQASNQGVDTQPILFIHIPKTAGISTVDYARFGLGKQTVFLDLNPGKCGYHFPTKAHDLKLDTLLNHYLLSKSANFFVWSHIPYIFAKRFKGKAFVMTLLRDPIERQLSHKRFFNLQKKSKLDELTYSESQALESSQTYNLQTLYLTSLDPYDPSIPIEDHLESAKFNLEHNIDFFGLTEYLNESLQELKETTKSFNEYKVRQLNITSDKPFLNPSCDLKVLREENWADVELYEFAKTLFLKRHLMLQVKS